MNRLKVNVSKTKYMKIGLKRSAVPMPLIIDGDEVEAVPDLKYLVVVIDRNVNLKKKLRMSVEKLRRKLK